MRPEDIQEQISDMRERARQLEEKLEDPALYSSPSAQKGLFRERQRLIRIFSLFDSWKKALSDASGNRELIQTEQDEEFKLLLENDLAELEKKAQEEEKALSLLLLPPDPNDGRSCIVEMRPAAGGEEAALFAADLFRMYSMYADRRGWRIELAEMNRTELGGVKEAVFTVEGETVNPFTHWGLYAATAASVGFGELVGLFLLGLPLMRWLPKQPFFRKYMDKFNT